MAIGPPLLSNEIAPFPNQEHYCPVCGIVVTMIMVIAPNVHFPVSAGKETIHRKYVSLVANEWMVWCHISLTKNVLLIVSRVL
jgi:hypothetical protein